MCRSGGGGGEGECVGLTAARAEADVDLGRIDHYPGGDLELEPAGQGLLGVVARQHIELDPSLTSGRVGFDSSGRAGDSPPLCSRPACITQSRRGGRRAG